MPELVLAACLLLAALALVKPYPGLLGYIALLYLNPGELYPDLDAYSLTRVVALALLASVFVLRVEGKRPGPVPPQMKYFGWYLGAILLSGLSGWLPAILEGIQGMIKNFVAFALIVTVVNTSRRLRGVIWWMILLGVVLAVPNITTYFSLGVEQERQSHLAGLNVGFMSGSGNFALATNVILAYAGCFVFGDRGLLRRVAALGAALVLIAGIITSHSRGAGVITLGAVLISWVVVSWRSGKILAKVCALLLVAIIAAGIVMAGPQAFKERASTIISYDKEITAQARIEYWKLGVKMFLSSPIWGVGAGGFPLNYHAFGGWERQDRVSHNTFVTIFSELGLVGAYCFFMMFGPTVRDLWRLGRRLRGVGTAASQQAAWIASAPLVALVAFFTGGMFQTVVGTAYPYLILALGVATLQIWPLSGPEPTGERTASALGVGSPAAR